MNKRGDIPVTVLVLGVFAVCTMALFSFAYSNFKIGNSFVGLDLVEKINSKYDEYSFYKTLGFDDNKIKTFLEEGEKDFLFEGNSFYVNKTQTKFRVSLSEWRREVFLFSAKYTPVN